MATGGASTRGRFDFGRIKDEEGAERRQGRSAITLSCGEAIDRDGVKLPAWLELCRREFGMIGRVRVMLRLQAERITTVVDLTAGAGNAAIKEVASVELDSWLVSEHFQHAPCRWLVGVCGQLNFPSSAIEDPILVVPLCQ